MSREGRTRGAIYRGWGGVERRASQEGRSGSLARIMGFGAEKGKGEAEMNAA